MIMGVEKFHALSVVGCPEGFCEIFVGPNDEGTNEVQGSMAWVGGVVFGENCYSAAPFQ